MAAESPGEVVRVLPGEAIGEVDEKYISFNIDVGQIAVPTRFWNPNGTGETTGLSSYNFDRDRLRCLVQALAPAYIRVAGTEADRVYYALDSTSLNNNVPPPPPPYKSVITAGHVDSIGRFAKDLGLQVVFTLNAGWGARDANHVWQADAASSLMRYVRGRGWPFAVWKLGNEPNAWPLFQDGLVISPEEYARDLAELARARSKDAPGSLIAGPGPAFWPNIGEVPTMRFAWPMQVFSGYLPRTLAAAEERTPPDIVTWHYYPGLSDRSLLARHRDHAAYSAFILTALTIVAFSSAASEGVDATEATSASALPRVLLAFVLRPLLLVGAAVLTAVAMLLRLVVRPVGPQSLCDPAYLETARHWGTQVKQLVDSSCCTGWGGAAPQLWLGETGSAQVGGQPGVSGRFVSCLWWLDQLGSLALLGHHVQCRQTLSGSDYGLIDEATLEPTPDFWASVLWKRCMGTRVFTTQVSTAGGQGRQKPSAPRTLRVYCHARGDTFTFVAINLGKAGVRLQLPRPGLVWLLDAPALDSKSVSINGTTAAADADGTVPELPGQPSESPVLPPLTALFAVVAPAASAAAS